MNGLAKKVAIVTGVSAPHGIGRAIAWRLAMAGAAVIISDVGGTISIDGRSLDRLNVLESLASEIQEQGGQATALNIDVTDVKTIRDGIAISLERYNGVDILVNNAGTTTGTGPFLNTTSAEWQTSFNVNLLGPMLFSQEIIPVMLNRGGGAIINIGSTGSLGAEAGFGAYTAMKHGLVGLTKTIAAEFGSSGIRCNAVCPGYIMTDMHADANARLAGERGISVADMMTERYAQVAMRRAGEPEEVASAVAYLASPASSYVTGITLPISGGTPVGI